METANNGTLPAAQLEEHWVYRDFCERLVPMLVLCISIFLFGGSLIKRVLPTMILGQLTYMTLAKPDLSVPADAAPLSKKQEKKLQQQIKRFSNQYGIAWNNMTEKTLYRLEFAEDYDTLLAAGVIVLINTVAAVILKYFIIPTYPLTIIIITVLGYGAIFMFLIKVEWAHGIIGRGDKFTMLIAGIIGASAAFSLLMYLPHNILPFDTAAASKEWLTTWDQLVGARFQARLNATAESMGLSLTQQPPRSEGPFAIATPLAVVAGLSTALLMSPGLRYGRVLQQLLKPPLWARNFGGGNTFMRNVARAGFMLQVILLPLWVNPLTDVFQVPESTLRYIRGLTLLLAALLQGMAVPALVQSFLYTAPYQVHILGRTPELSEDIKSKLIQQTTQLTLVQTCKAAMQLSFVPLLMMLCALLYLVTGFPSPVAERYPQWSASQGSSVVFPCCTGFIGWWANNVYIAWASLGVMIARLARTTDT